MNVYTLSQMAAMLGASADTRMQKVFSLALAVGVFLEPRSGNNIGQRLQPMWKALETGNYEFYFDAVGRPVGFVNWMSVDDSDDAALLAGELDAASLPSCKAGDKLWIMDFFASNHSLRPILANLRDRFCGKYDEAKYHRVRGNSRVVKRFALHDRSAALRPAATVATEDSVGLTRSESVWNGYRHFVSELLASGERLLALRRCDPLLRSPLWNAIPLLRNLTALQQVRVYRDADGVPAGLLTWGWLSEYTVSRLGVTPLHAVHNSEWNEGRALCFCDLAVSEGVRAQMMHDVHSGLFPEQDTILLYTPPSEQGCASVQRVSRSTETDAIAHWAATASIERLQ